MGQTEYETSELYALIDYGHERLGFVDEKFVERRDGWKIGINIDDTIFNKSMEMVTPLEVHSRCGMIRRRENF